MVVGRTDHLPGGAAPNWVSPKQGSGPMARHAVTLVLLRSKYLGLGFRWSENAYSMDAFCLLAALDCNRSVGIIRAKIPHDLSNSAKYYIPMNTSDIIGPMRMWHKLSVGRKIQ